jgi:trehalose 6-phosphate phosphatase
VTASVRDAAAANHAATELFAALDVQTIALLLDVDGTVVDIAPRPDEVHVPDELCRALARLLDRTGGALALVSGRPIRDLDGLFSPLVLPAVGGHGAEMRVRDGEVTGSVNPLSQRLRAALARAQDFAPGIVVEDKGYSLGLHYRGAPQTEERLRAHIAAVRAEFAGEATEVLPGKALFEVKRPGVNKGNGVRQLMQHPPFAGRRPVFIGDDVTDAAVFDILPELGGIGFSVSRHFEGTAGIFESPGAVRRALQRLAGIA